MIVVDAQVHPFAANTPERPWAREMPEAVHLPEVTGDQMVAAMGAAGVDRAIAVSPVRVYDFDASYAETVYRDHPDRFRLVTPVHALAPNAVARIKRWAATPGAVGIRMLFELMQMSPDDPQVAAAVHAAVDADLTINISCWGRLEVMEPMARKFPEARFALDHLGMTQSVEPPAPKDPFADIEAVLALAKYPNLNIKVTGACTVSHEPYPYEDLWQPVGRVIDAFGVDRCMWGSDWTRATLFLTYEQSLSAYSDHWPMSVADKEKFLGGTALRVYNWDRW
ncbi:MAG TPA: amidohydrolase family protein [Kineosporiaceae bacterium]|nr:amidohydrolase family protein [Kineosporiaceae bacterium]